MYDVVKKFKRPGSELLSAFSTMQPATLHEAMGKRGAMKSDIRPVWPGTTLCGSALTVYSRPGDNLMLHKAVSVAQPGDVLVVTVDGYLEAGIWGEIITVAAMEKGIKGIVTDGSVRDTMPIKEMGFPMFCRGMSMKGTYKQNPGRINTPVTLCGVCVNPGDIIVADNDGVVVVPLDEAEKVLKAAIEKEEAERMIMDRIRKGECTLDILGLNDAYLRLGLKEEND